MPIVLQVQTGISCCYPTPKLGTITGPADNNHIFNRCEIEVKSKQGDISRKCATNV